jgi:hypothetical protein
MHPATTAPAMPRMVPDSTWPVQNHRESMRSGRVLHAFSQANRSFTNHWGVRHAFAVMLQVRCHRTGAAKAWHPAEAIRICERLKEPIHPLITDVEVPEMGGQQVAAHVAACRQGIKLSVLPVFESLVDNRGICR